MVDLTASKRRGMPSSQFALSGKRFPMNDATHQRLAIGGATRAANAGNISASTAARIKAEARAKLGIKNSPGGYTRNPLTEPPGNNADAMRMHALSIASASHLHNAGHLPAMDKARIHAKARSALNALKAGPQPQMGQPQLGQPQQPQAFGSLAPNMEQIER